MVYDNSNKYAVASEAAHGNRSVLTDIVFSSTGPGESQTKEIFHKILGNRVLFNYSYFHWVSIF